MERKYRKGITSDSKVEESGWYRCQCSQSTDEEEYIITRGWDASIYNKMEQLGVMTRFGKWV